MIKKKKNTYIFFKIFTYVSLTSSIKRFTNWSTATAYGIESIRGPNKEGERNTIYKMKMKRKIERGKLVQCKGE